MPANTWQWRLLRSGGFWLDAGAMFGMIPRTVWTRWLTPDDSNRMPLQTNGLLLQSGPNIVVVEVGIGDKLGDKERQIYRQEDRTVVDALREAGCDPRDVTHVFLTHLHFDHAGGLTRKGSAASSGTPPLTFPNARIVVQRREWEDALANKSTMHKTYLRDHLTPEVAERLMLVDGESEPLPGITVWPTPGHTWGQQTIRFLGARGETVCFVPDVMPTALHASPTTNMAYDVEPYVSMLERTKLLDRAQREGWLVIPNHDPKDAVYGVEAAPDRPGQHRVVSAAQREG